MAFFNKNIAIVKNIKSIPQEAIVGEKLDLITKTLKILSKKMVSTLSAMKAFMHAMRN